MPPKKTKKKIGICQKRVNKKIKEVIQEKKYPRKQSVAIAYHIVKNEYPRCKKHLMKKKSGLKSKKSKKKVGLCKKRISKKIKEVIGEKKYPIKQSIAIAYSIVNKKYPHCKQHLKPKLKKK